MNIPNSLSNVAGVAVAPINASATVAAGGAGGKSVFAGLVVSDKGRPFEVLKVNKKNVFELLGHPLKPSTGEYAASLRCVEDALQGGDGYVVRVVPETAKFACLSVQAVDSNSGKNAVFATALPYSQAPSVAVDDLMKFYIYDGAIIPRSVELLPISGKVNAFNLNVYTTDDLGNEFVEKSWLVSTDINALNDMGDSAFICEVLDRESAFIRCIVSDSFAANEIVEVSKTALLGATSGQQSDLNITDFQKAAKVLSGSMVGFTAVVGLGITDGAILELLADIANSRRIDAFFDIDAPTYIAAIDAMQSNAFNYHRVCCYFFPYNCKDAYFGVQMHWGISGIAFSAKAAGVAMVDGNVGGWHVSPAGALRGVINRKNAQPFNGLDEPDYDALYKARINKIGLTKSGILMIDDAITTHQREDYLRFQHVSSLMDAISRDFYSMAQDFQHEPDGVTYKGLLLGMSAILDGYVASGALVKPRNPDVDGDSPYILLVEQDDIDYWSVKWSCCPTGCARRIMGIPALIR